MPEPAIGRAVKASLALPLIFFAACELQTTEPPPEYRPGQAGTVDHALCLLGFTGIPLRELSSGHHLVDVTLNGREATFVLDTGANATVLHAGHAEQFGISGGTGLPGGAVGLGGGMKASQVGIDSLRIGPVPVRQNRIMTANLDQLTNLLSPLADEAIHGIIGQDVMNEHRAVIDVSRPILHLIEADKEPSPVSAAQCRDEAVTSPENS